MYVGICVAAAIVAVARLSTTGTCGHCVGIVGVVEQTGPGLCAWRGSVGVGCNWWRQIHYWRCGGSGSGTGGSSCSSSGSFLAAGKAGILFAVNY